MNKYTVFGAGLVTGLLAGFVAGYFVQKKQHDKELDDVSKSYHDIFEEQRKRIEEADEELNRGRAAAPPESILSPLEGSRSDSKVYKHNYTAYSENGVVEDPTMVIQHKSSIKEPEVPLEEYLSDLHPMDSDEDEDQKEEELYNEGLMASLNHEANRYMTTKIIKEEDYGNDGTLEQESLFYYQGSDILVTEDDEEIHDLPLVVGDCLDKFGFRDNDEKRICVRNYKLGKDYEVIKIFSEYVP